MPELTPYQLAEQKIAEALKTGATKLDLSQKYDAKDSEKLTEFPESLWQLKQLTKLNLNNNQLTALPDSLGQLTQLTELDLSRNQLTALSDSMGQLTQLTELNLSYNQLTALPDSLGQLTQLTEIWLNDNKLNSLPESLGQLINLRRLMLSNGEEGIPLGNLPHWISHLTNLEMFWAQSCKLKDIPDWIGQLSNLTELVLQDNEISELPSSMRRLRKFYHLALDMNKIVNLPLWLIEFNNLQYFSIGNNPLNPALQSAYDACEHGKYEPLFAYLRSLEQNAEPLYEAKLVLVGEGNVGKTTLLKALRMESKAGKNWLTLGKDALLNALKGKGDEEPRKNETTTHGVEIDINGLRLPHPEKDGVEIQLNAWDFGGQDVYRVTHQFFFSRRSLYLLVWEPRNNVQQGRVDEWLDMIRLRVGGAAARVIIVSTHCKSGGHLARIDKPVFKERYGDMIVDFYEVDSLVPDEATGEMVGIAELKKVIAAESAKLEQMGMGFNNNWKAARDELLAREEAKISYTTFAEVCAKHSLSEIDTSTLAHLMHDLGYIVHYSDDENLRDDVVLKPQWLTKAIGFILEDRATAEREGILPDGHLTRVWRDHAFEGEPRYDPNVYPFFLRLMEKYDVCYRLTDGKASLVAQHVPQVRPVLPWLPEQEPPKDQRRIAMVCSMEEDPPGLVPWMIVRTHDYAYPHNEHSLHWQKGMFLSHGTHGTAMIEKRDREFHVYAQAAWPEHFMNVLHSTLEKLISDNWPGLEGRYLFAVPCSEIKDGQPCKGRFPIHSLRQWLAEGDSSTRCQICSKRHSITELLMGFEERPVDVQIREINEKLDGLDSRIADYFMRTLHAIANEAKSGPRLFTFRARETNIPLQQLFMRPLELQLWCEHEGHPHPVMDAGKGVYQIDQPQDWVVKFAPYANFVLDVLKTVAPMVSPAINIVKGPKTTDPWKDYLDLGKAIIDKLPAEIKVSDRGMTPGQMLSEPERSGILALHRFLNETDPTQAKLGLHRVTTYTGDYRWLCKSHFDAYQPNIPDVIPAPNH